ncbi:telomerase Cajal body protein 1 homolog [Pectinophora gossypiella]|uniref:telomerase Cajal body protein 1 homolog n=1 Tax=Pectinophora gossypiella TaxID=13191 RepID=UPI00214E6F4F|nr:telomerase Cajal body protein 1 homolog [Pectinophora gossypiella]
MEETSMETDTLLESESNGHTNDNMEDVADVNTEDRSCYQYPTLFMSKTLLELCNSSWTRAPKAKEDVQPYLRGCKWSPDGTCCLSVVNNDGVHITELPRDLYTESASPDRNIDILESVVHVKEAGLIYDFCWFPGMNSHFPETCCWLTTRQNAPIQMWDAFDGSLRCSYRGFNAADEMEPALCVTFTPEANSIIGGYKKFLRTFDVDRPGRDFSEHKIGSPAASLAVNSNLLAVGSWNTTIALYNVNDMGTYKSIGKMHGHTGGITHMKFTPDGLKLVSGARKDHRLLVWDIRYYRRPLNILSRVVDTNQRVYFDISPCGKYLVSGNTDGTLKVWDVDQVDWKSELDTTDIHCDKSTKFPLHNDCCNSVSIHPLRPILATGSGQYHCRDPIQLLDDENQTDGISLNGDINSSHMSDTSAIKDFNVSENKESSRIEEDISSSENCLVFWWIGDVPGID